MLRAYLIGLVVRLVLAAVCLFAWLVPLIVVRSNSEITDLQRVTWALYVLAAAELLSV